MAGHSLGELVALHAAGVFDPPTLLRLARRRGELVREAAGDVEGAMLAVLAAPAQVEVDLAGIDGICIANHNGPGEVVLSGTLAGIASAEAMFTERGVAVRHLNTATAFHSSIVAPAVTPLRTHLAGLAVSAPHVDVFGNLDAAPYPADPDEIRDRLAAQVASPVRFTETIEAMYRAGIRTFVEVGAGGVLTGMVDRILGGSDHVGVALDRRGVNGLTRMQQALGQLAVLGVPLDFTSLWDEPEPSRARPEPLMPIRIGGGVYGRPYPPPGGAAALPPANPEPPSANAGTPQRPPAVGAPPPVPTSPHELSHADRAPSPSVMARGTRVWLRARSQTLPEPVTQPASHPAVGGNAPVEQSIPDGERLRTIEALHRQVAQTHEVYQQAMAEGHIAFLKMAEASLAALAGSPGGVSPEWPADDRAHRSS